MFLLSIIRLDIVYLHLSHSKQKKLNYTTIIYLYFIMKLKPIFYDRLEFL